MRLLSIFPGGPKLPVYKEAYILVIAVSQHLGRSWHIWSKYLRMVLCSGQGPQLWKQLPWCSSVSLPPDLLLHRCTSPGTLTMPTACKSDMAFPSLSSPSSLFSPFLFICPSSSVQSYTTCVSRGFYHCLDITEYVHNPTTHKRYIMCVTTNCSQGLDEQYNTRLSGI